MATILLVEDNPHILKINADEFTEHGHTVLCAECIEKASELLMLQDVDLMILDVMLPDGNGLEYMKALRQGREGDVPILLLTGLTSQEDVIQGLAAGGDDYLTKPYDFPILLARIEALLRRADRIPKTLQAGKLVLDITSCTASMEGRDLLLTQKEFALLSLFVQNQGQVISGEYLYEKVWKTSTAGDTQALKTAVARLRNKIRESGFCIVSVRGEGYCLEQE